MFESMMAAFPAMMVSQPFWITFVILGIIPYGMFVVARVFEGRKIGNGPNDIPLWKDQSKAYFPGDIGLALFLAVAIYHRNQLALPSWAATRWYAAFCALGAIGVYVVARRYFYSPKDYDEGAWNSPSKRYHDVVMYLVYGFYAAYFAVPFYLFGDWGGAHFASGLVGIFGFTVWAACMIYDVSSDEVPNERQHPNQWPKR